MKNFLSPESDRADAVLVLANGSMFNGHTLQETASVVGPIQVITELVGFQEHLCHDDNKNKILLFTTPHIGITGANDQDVQAAIAASGVVMRDPARKVSNFRAQRSLLKDIADQGVASIFGIDTRMVAREIGKQNLMAGIFVGKDLQLSTQEQLEMITGYEGSGN